MPARSAFAYDIVLDGRSPTAVERRQVSAHSRARARARRFSRDSGQLTEEMLLRASSTSPLASSSAGSGKRRHGTMPSLPSVDSAMLSAASAAAAAATAAAASSSYDGATRSGEHCACWCTLHDVCDKGVIVSDIVPRRKRNTIEIRQRTPRKAGSCTDVLCSRLVYAHSCASPQRSRRRSMPARTRRSTTVVTTTSPTSWPSMSLAPTRLA